MPDPMEEFLTTALNTMAIILVLAILGGLLFAAWMTFWW